MQAFIVWKKRDAGLVVVGIGREIGRAEKS